MIPVPAAETIRKIDLLTTEKQNISFETLMERAGTAAASWLLEKFPGQKEFIVYCGYGNNGGDGLVISRLLAERSRNVKTIVVEGTGKATDAFNSNYKKLKEQLKAGIEHLAQTEQHEIPPEKAILIDAIFGNGLNRTPEGLPLEIIRLLNTLSNTIVSIDVPAGLFSDRITEEANCIQADYTLAFQFPRLPFFFAETGNFTGEWHILDIQLEQDKSLLSTEKIYLTEPSDLQHWLKGRNKFSHKNNFGHSFLLAGSKGKCGAALLSAKACLRSGAGLVTVRLPQSCVLSMQSSLPEAMVSEDDGKEYNEVPIYPLNYSAVAAGPGLGTAKETGNVLKRMLQDYKGPLVLDADAINLLAENKTWLSFLPPETILTPHLGEFKRLAGEENDPFKRLSIQRELSRKYHIIIVLKGRYTLISLPDGTVVINPTGNPGMSTAGSGDVLTGIITAFRSQGYSALASAVCGVYLHGFSGDMAAEKQGETGLIATDLIEQIPSALKKIMQEK